MSKSHEIYLAWLQSDKAYQAELVQEYGSSAQDARYDAAKNMATHKLVELRHEFLNQRERYMASL